MQVSWFICTGLLFVLITVRATEREHTGTFDFIIVGAGTAGSVVAGRLCTSLPQARILLLERGKPRSTRAEFLVRSSRMALDTWFDPEISKPVVVEPEPAFNNRQMPGTTGSTLGGSSSINFAQFTLPKNGTFEDWNFAGLSSTHALELLERIKRQLKVGPSAPSRLPDYHRELIEAAKRSGFRLTTSPHDGNDDDNVHITNDAVDDVGRRVDSYTGFVSKPIRSQCRKMLRLVQDATVERVLSRRSKAGRGSPLGGPFRAYAVEYRQGPKRLVAKAKYEIILAAGPMGSPQILQLSGIGPADILSKAGVPVVHQLPVGQYAQGRVMTILTHQYTAPLSNANNKSLYASARARQQLLDGKGGLFGLNIAGVNGKLHSVGEFVSLFGFGLSFTHSLDRPLFQYGCLLNPERNSHSQLWINDSNVLTAPHMRLGVLNTKEELQRGVACVSRLISLSEEITKEIGGFVISPPNVSLSSPDATKNIESFVTEAAQNAFHFVGSCAVGRVVNRYFKVIGFEGLRVVDASVIPRIPESAGPLASVYIVAYHAANLLMSQYSFLRSVQTQRRQTCWNKSYSNTLRQERYCNKIVPKQNGSASRSQICRWA